MSVVPSDAMLAMPVAWPRRLGPKTAVRAFVAAHPEFEGRVWVWSLRKVKPRRWELGELRWRPKKVERLFVVEGSEFREGPRWERPKIGDVVIDLYTSETPRIGVYSLVACPACNGTGESRSGRSMCWTCGGRGMVAAPRWISVIS